MRFSRPFFLFSDGTEKGCDWPGWFKNATERLYLTLRVRKIRTLYRSSKRRMSKGRFSFILAVGFGTLAAIPVLQGQQPAQTNPQAAPDSQAQDPLKRQLSDKERFKQQKELKQELHGSYKKWVDEDVHWIITDQELKAFKSLSNDEERDAFIEQFWQRRNPSPDSPENEFREEHYRRIAYSNEHFAAGKPGWKTDRGHMYISFGKPDSIDSHPSGGMYDRPIAEGGGQTSTFPFEVWHYRYLEGVGDNIDIEFVDTCMCGDYHMTIDRSEKDALQHVPGAGATLYEQMGMSKQSERFQGGLENLGKGPNSAMTQSKQFDRLEQFAKLQAPPPVKFKDLESFLANHKLLTGPIFPIRCADRLREGDGRYGAGAGHSADQESRYHLQHERWRRQGPGEYPGPSFDDYRSRRADL